MEQVTRFGDLSRTDRDAVLGLIWAPEPMIMAAFDDVVKQEGFSGSKLSSTMLGKVTQRVEQMNAHGSSKLAW